jgi:hypothetical protein
MDYIISTNPDPMIKFNVLPVLLLILGITGCELDDLQVTDNDVQDQSLLKSVKTGETLKATGFIELLWKGKEKGGDKGNKPEDLLTFLDFNAHEGTRQKSAKGEIIFQVLETDYSLHREIKADVFDVLIDPGTKKAWIVGRVVSDSKGCLGDGQGGHDSNCSGGHEETDGGCSHDDTGTDGGCSHDDTDTDEGCLHDDTGTDGGCTDDDSSHDGGCTHETASTESMGGSSAPGGDDKGNPVSGKNCRTGQLIAMKLHDGGSPGMSNDGITWKWFDPEADFVPAVENIALWPHLCKKTIIDGNLVVHTQ